jgi:hypothetical protein
MGVMAAMKHLFGSQEQTALTQAPTPEPEKPKKTWQVSQDYELDHAVIFMDSPDFRSLAASMHNGEFNASSGYVNDLMLKEFFASDRMEWDKFIAHITGKRCMEIGPCVFSPLGGWDVAAERHVIEPLYQPIDNWQREHFGYSVFDGLKMYGVGAEVLIPELVGKIDGALLCRNCIDHSPQWAFILANISQYCAPGAKLLLWNDIDHKGTADDGHYDITTDPAAFRRLIEALGFDIIRTYTDESRMELNWGCFAVKR